MYLLMSKEYCIKEENGKLIKNKPNSVLNCINCLGATIISSMCNKSVGGVISVTSFIKFSDSVVIC